MGWGQGLVRGPSGIDLAWGVGAGLDSMRNESHFDGAHHREPDWRVRVERAAAVAPVEGG